MLADGLADRMAARLDRGRAAAEARRGSRCTIRRDGGLGTQREDGVQPRLWPVIHADEPVEVVGAHSGASATRTLSTPSGDVEVPVKYLRFRWDLTGLQDGDLVEITAGRTAGETFQLLEVTPADNQTALRIPVIAARRPDEWDEEAP